ncbi:hypothetical protein [Yersinia hibernica]|uniref:hypothetical protein n=1 Tax=Yersinia hibernica TaxID=2339259 RepID=UPI00042EA89F
MTFALTDELKSQTLINRLQNELNKIINIDDIAMSSWRPFDMSINKNSVYHNNQQEKDKLITVNTLKIDNLESYYFNVYFSEYYLDKIIPQSHIVSQINGQEIPLLIESVSSIVENGKFKAKLIPYQDSISRLKRGQSIEIKISLQEDNNVALLVPTESIISERNGNSFIYIYQPEKNQALKSKIDIKRKHGLKTEVTAGLIAGQQIVIPPDNNNNEYDIIEFK